MVGRLFTGSLSHLGVPRTMSSTSWREEQLKAIDDRIAELKLLKAKLILAKQNHDRAKTDL